MISRGYRFAARTSTEMSGECTEMLGDCGTEVRLLRLLLLLPRLCTTATLLGFGTTLVIAVRTSGFCSLLTSSTCVAEYVGGLRSLTFGGNAGLMVATISVPATAATTRPMSRTGQKCASDRTYLFRLSKLPAYLIVSMELSAPFARVARRPSAGQPR